jgi:hypothetical protein
MELQQTKWSVRGYLVLMGMAAVAMFVGLAVDLVTDPKFQMLPAIWRLALWTEMISTGLLGTAFIIAGLTVEPALPIGARMIKRLVLFAAKIACLQGVLLVVAELVALPPDCNPALLSRSACRALMWLCAAAGVFARLSARAELESRAPSLD